MAVVGARKTDAYGLALARRVAIDAVELGYAVVSGGAEGCDRAAHEATMEAGGKTIVVLPAGHRHIYPRAHASLFERIAKDGGAVVSTRPPDARLARPSFLARNRVIAELAQAVVVVRAETRSGSFSTAEAARKLGKRVGAVPGDVGQALSEGCHRLLSEGAVPIVGPPMLARLLDRPELGSSWPTRLTGSPAPWPKTIAVPLSGLDAGEEAVLAVVREEPGLDLDTIAMRTSQPLEVVLGIVTSLEVRGVARRMPGGRYAARS